MIRIYIIGVTILIVAIIANGTISKLAIKSWYDFISLLTNYGISAFGKLTIFDAIWLFIGYPMILGLGYKLGDKLSQLILN
jgi:hypothetical protein